MENKFLSNDNIIELITNDIATKMQNLRKEIILKRLKEVAGVSLDFDAESKKRFKSLSLEYKDNEEVIYYNDGSKDGLRIVTFVNERSPDLLSGNIKISINFYYY